MHTVRVRTTQNVVIDYPLAGLGDRMLDLLFDVVIQGAQALLCWFVLNQLQSHTDNIYTLMKEITCLPPTREHN